MRRAYLLPLTAMPLAGCERHEAPKPTTSAGSRASVSARPAMPSPMAQKPTGPPLGVSPGLHGVGERAMARDYTMTVLKVEPCVVEPHFQAKPGHIKLGVEVQIEGRSERAVATNPFAASLRDSNDEDYKAALAGCEPTLRAGHVSSGETARGFISFEVPRGATGFVMKYAPFIVGAGPEELRFSLGR